MPSLPTNWSISPFEMDGLLPYPMCWTICELAAAPPIASSHLRGCAGLKPAGLRASFSKALHNWFQQADGQLPDLTNTGVRVREATAEELRAWDQLVMRFDNYRLFHKQSWLRYIAAFSHAKPLYLIFEKGGTLVACLPGFLMTIGSCASFFHP